MAIGEQISFADESAEYRAFVDKFKPKKTTDDCYTPDNIMEAVNDWTAREFGIDCSRFVRPFWPGGDYERFDYPKGCAVVDNPPFSLSARIYDFYDRRGIPFLLFAPTLTCVNALNKEGIRTRCVLLCGAKITYENGANINTSFVTNMDRTYCVRTVPTLYKALKEENKRNEKAKHKELPKYSYPPAILSGGGHALSKYGLDFRVRHDEAVFIRMMDAQRLHGEGQGIFGGGLLLSKRAAAERAAAERAGAERAGATVWALSEREIEIQEKLGAGEQE